MDYTYPNNTAEMSQETIENQETRTEGQVVNSTGVGNEVGVETTSCNNNPFINRNVNEEEEDNNENSFENNTSINGGIDGGISNIPQLLNEYINSPSAPDYDIQNGDAEEDIIKIEIILHFEEINDDLSSLDSFIVDDDETISVADTTDAEGDFSFTDETDTESELSFDDSESNNDDLSSLDSFIGEDDEAISVADITDTESEFSYDEKTDEDCEFSEDDTAADYPICPPPPPPSPELKPQKFPQEKPQKFTKELLEWIEDNWGNDPEGFFEYFADMDNYLYHIEHTTDGWSLRKKRKHLKRLTKNYMVTGQSGITFNPREVERIYSNLSVKTLKDLGILPHK